MHGTLDPSVGQMPRHVAIIMDGNGRWAKARGLPRSAGHRKGVEAVRRAIEAAGDLGIRYVTLYSFSTENWRRPADEIGDLMHLLRYYLRGEIATLHKNGVRIKVIGERDRLAPDIVSLIDNAEALTVENQALTLVLALSYGARQEIVEAARHLAREAAAGRIDAAEIDERLMSSSLSTGGIPDPDLVIRTSGEKRISNFLLWQIAYAEFVFVDTLWPDFTKRDLEDAVQEFCRRERRFGASVGSR